MILKFSKTELQFLFITPLSQIKGKQSFSQDVIKNYKKKLAILMNISKIEELRFFRGLNFEYLKGDRKGQCSIRLNYQFRLIFEPINENEVKLILINEISKHYE
jgi:plasmid maintenance system killer protein